MSGEDLHQFTLCPLGSFSFPYLDVTTLSVGALSTTQFPLAWLQLHWLLLYSSTQVILPSEKEGDSLKVIPFLKEALWESSDEDPHLSSPVLLLVPSVSSHPHRDAGSQTEEAISFSAALEAVASGQLGQSSA